MPERKKRTELPPGYEITKKGGMIGIFNEEEGRWLATASIALSDNLPFLLRMHFEAKYAEELYQEILDHMTFLQRLVHFAGSLK